MGKHIMVLEARCSFPRLYGTEKRDDEEFGPGSALVLEKVKHRVVLAVIKETMREVIADNEKLKKNPPVIEKLCLRKPDREELKYMEGNLVLKANNPRPPMVLCSDGVTIMTESTNQIYSGCYVNAKIEIWGQANKYGRRVNAKLIAVQYVPKAADSFDGSYVSPDEAVKGFGSLDSADIPSGDDLGRSDVTQDDDDDDILG